MATVPSNPVLRLNDYPTTDGKPMAETDWHRELMFTLIHTLMAYYAGNPRVYVSGNLLLFYERGNKRRHLAPDVFVVKGVPNRERPNYLVWEEGKGPNLVIELTSSSTRHRDVTVKYRRYQDTLRVPEYFLFDPLGDYLEPQLQGHRLRGGRYGPVRPVHGRLPSQVLGLHLEGAGRALRLYDPSAREWLPTPEERLARTQQQLLQSQQQVIQSQRESLERLAELEGELQRLRLEVEELRGRRP